MYSACWKKLYNSLRGNYWALFCRGGGGCPIIGDNVIIFSGAKVIGNVRVSNNVIIGANAVVTRDVTNNAVVVGSPTQIINNNSDECIAEEWKCFFGL